MLINYLFKHDLVEFKEFTLLQNPDLKKIRTTINLIQKR